MLFACLPFLVTAGYLEINKMYKLYSVDSLVSYLRNNGKSQKERRSDLRAMKRIAMRYPQNFNAIMSKRGGTILHCCVDFRNAEMVPVVARFVNVNARYVYSIFVVSIFKNHVTSHHVAYLQHDALFCGVFSDMYGRTALSQARRIHRNSSDDVEKRVLEDLIAALHRAGSLRNRQMRWYSKFWQYLGMTASYFTAAFYVLMEKLILFGVYVVSTERADILHLLFLLYFLVFLVLGWRAHKYWYLLVAYNGFAISIRYALSVKVPMV